jgi:Uma2 family endonuclease
LRPDGHLYGAPDLVIEVLSPGTANERRDRDLKLALYDRWHVPEYWIADWEHRTVEVYRREEDRLALTATLGETESLTSPQLQGFTCTVSSLFVGLPA